MSLDFFLLAINIFWNVSEIQLGENLLWAKVWLSFTLHFSPNLFHGQITQISIHQLSGPENKKLSP